MNPKDLEQRYAKGIAAHQAGRIAEAEAIYANLLKEVPDADAVNTNMAALQYGKGNYKKALLHADKALKVNPVNLDALVNRATTLMAMDRHQEAQEAFESVLKIAPTNVLGHYNLGLIHFQKDELSKSAACFRRALDLKPDFFQAAFNLGNVMVALRKQTEAEALYVKVLHLAPAHEGAHLNLSNLFAAMGLLEKSFDQIELAIEILPLSWLLWNAKSKLELEIGHGTKALVAADRAIEINRDSVDAWIHRGNALRRLDRLEEATDAYEMALALEPEHEGALRNLRRLSASGIPSWHFHMLADTARNAAFDAALRKVVKPGDLVLDIGTGSGLLAMMAARAGASKVIACEATPAIAEAAEAIVASNGYDDRVEVYGLHSGLLKVGAELPREADVIVTEILDAALLGEGMLPSIRAALRSLAKPNAVVIPSAATVQAQLVYLPNHLSQGKLGNVEGFDLREFERFRIPAEYEVVHLETHLRHGRSEVVDVKYINFTQLGPAIDEERPERFSVDFDRLVTGSVNGLALWFQLELDATITLSSGPGGELRHWGQAIFFFEEPQEVHQGERFTVQGAFSDMMWRFWLEDK